jgi:hypothetical protein
MSQDGTADWLVSEDELTHLTTLFIRFEGALDPRDLNSREAESDFYSILDRLFREKVKSSEKYSSVTEQLFISHARHLCRLRATRIVKEFPCP